MKVTARDGDIHALPKSTNGKTQRCRLLHDRAIMRVKFEATDSAGRVHKRSSTSHIYSHCVVVHFAANPPSELWPAGVAACSHAEWEQSFALAERKASRWRKKPHVEAEILEAKASLMPIPTVKSRELASNKGRC